MADLKKGFEKRREDVNKEGGRKDKEREGMRYEKRKEIKWRKKKRGKRK